MIGSPSPKPKSGRPQSAARSRAQGSGQQAAGKDPAGGGGGAHGSGAGGEAAASSATGSEPKPGKRAEEVEAKFYEDGKFYKAVLGERVTEDKQLVMFVGYEDDGWQETLSKDIRFVAGKIQLGKGTKPKDPKEQKEQKEQKEPNDSKESGGKDAKTGDKGKASKGRTGKKWEVVTGFLNEATTGTKGSKSQKTSEGSRAPQEQAGTVPANQPAASSQQAGERQNPPGGAPSSAAQAKASAEEDETALGVSYDLLTSLTERIEDIGMFENTQVDEEGLTSILTTPEGKERYKEMCKRLVDRICRLDGIPVARANSREDLQKFLQARDYPLADKGLNSARLRFSALEFLLGEAQCGQMLVEAQRHRKTNAQEVKGSSTTEQPASGPVSTTIEQDTSVLGTSGQMMKENLHSISLVVSPDRTQNKARASEIVKQATSFAQETLRGLPSGYMGEAVLPQGSLNEEQVQVLAEVSQELRIEYSLRKEMLLQRLGVIASSFSHSKHKREGAADVLGAWTTAQIKKLQVQPSFSIYDLYCARTDVASQCMPAQHMLESSLKQVLIGRVPDRGGRVEEIDRRTMNMEVRRANDAMKGKDAPRGGGRGRGQGPSRDSSGAASGGAGVQVSSGSYHPEYASNMRGGSRGGGRGGGRPQSAKR